MNKKSNFLIVSLAVTIGLFIYLTFHHFALKLGMSGSSLCEINSKINCDAAATSAYAEILGIPVAILGGVFHCILLGFVLFARLDWVESDSYLQKSLRLMLALAVLTSLIMGSISVFLVKVICPFCTATYIMAFINAALGWNLIQPDAKAKDRFKLSGYWGAYRSHLIALAAIPFLSWAFTGMIQSNYGLDELRKQVPEKIALWKSGTQFSFEPTLGLTNKVTSPRVSIVEFADFKCPHCKAAADTFDIFLKGRADVQFIYKPYPLDGTCNAAVSQKGDGSRCQMAAMVLCADELFSKGWELHHFFFKNQEKYFAVADVKKILPDIQAELGLDTAKLSDCADSAETYETIRRSSAEGDKAQVEGTPTVYVNGKKLPWGQFLEVLQAADSEIK
jgi:protein-disulfide isomerase/uncharacterized membrane protein